MALSWGYVVIQWHTRGLQDCEGKSIQELCRCVQVKDFPAVHFISTPEHPRTRCWLLFLRLSTWSRLDM